MAITAKELAKLLSLSESAVSLALNQKPGVSTATRKRVWAAAEKHGYDFTRLRDVSGGFNQGSIFFAIYKKHGAVVMDTPFFSELTEGVATACKTLQCFLNIQYLHADDDIPSVLAAWKRGGCQGLILLGTEMERYDILPFLQSGLPLVLLDNYFEDLDLDCVLINNIKGAYTATDYLIRKRGKQPGYLRSSYPINNFGERADGFYKAVRKNGMSASRSIVHRLTPSADGAYADMREVIERGDELADCYFADNDWIAAGAVRALRESGRSIPKDVAVIGFDDMPVCTYVDPPLTTIHVPKHYMGRMAVERLYELIRGSDCKPVKIEISTMLRKRKSC